MGEVLSQSEIDNLLKQLNSGELDVEEMKNTEEKTVKDYDFARPAKFSKEHLRTLEIIDFRSRNLFGIFQCIIQPGTSGSCGF